MIFKEISNMDEGRLQRKLERLEKEKSKARKAGDRAEEERLCNVAGDLLAQHRLFEEAIKEHKKELDLSESVKDPIDIAISHRKLGECFCELNDFKNALFHQHKHLEISLKSHDLVEEQRARATLGRTYFLMADISNSKCDMEKAKTWYTESLSICDQLGDKLKEKELVEMRARLYLNLGLVHGKLNNEEEGMKLIRKALVIAVKKSLKDTEYRCHISLGHDKLSGGHPAEALQCFRKAWKVAQHQKNQFHEADTLVQMGKALLSLGDFKNGKNILKRCLKNKKHGNDVNKLRSNLLKAIKGTKLLEKLQIHRKHNKTPLRVFGELGDIFSQVKCYWKAIRYYDKQLKLSEKLKKSNQKKAVICDALACSYADNKEYDKAKEYFLKELGLREGESDEQCNTWCNIAKMKEASGDGYENIKQAYRNAFNYAKNAQKPDKQVRVLELLAEVQTKFSKEEHLKKTLNEISCLEDGKMEESEENEEESQGEEIGEEDELLIEQEMELSDEDEDEELNERNEKGETVLHRAAMSGNYNLAETSIEKGVSVHARDYCGLQPLHEACYHGKQSIVKLLLRKGADINDPGGPHCCGITPLHDATENGHVAVVELLVEREADVTLKNEDGQTALDVVLKAIADADQDPDDQDPDPKSKTREQLKTILENAMSSTKTVEMMGKDQLNHNESSDEGCSTTVTEASHVSTNAVTVSRKRKRLSSVTDCSVKDGTRDSEVSDNPPATSPGPSIPSTTLSKARDFSAPMRVNVKVKDKTFCIPCSTATEEKKTVRWLAEQATLRYHKACGLKPVLSLLTDKGAILSPDDEVRYVLRNDELVIASVESRIG